MNNDKLEELKKGLENFSVDSLEDKEKSKDVNLEIDFSSINWNTIFSSTASGANISTAASSGNYTFNGSNGNLFSASLWNSGTTSPSSLHVQGDAEFEGDIKIKGTSLSDRLAAIENRLSILVPDPEKLEHYEALKKAYEHYKILEALCAPPEKEEK